MSERSMPPSMSSSLAESGLISAGWLNVAGWASTAQNLPASAPTVMVTLSIAIGGIILQLLKMYLDFRGRQQSFELDQAKHDLGEKDKIIEIKDEELKIQHDELTQRAQEVDELRSLLYGPPKKDHDVIRSPGAALGQPKPVD